MENGPLGKAYYFQTNILSSIVYIDYLLYLDLRSNPDGIYK